VWNDDMKSGQNTCRARRTGTTHDPSACKRNGGTSGGRRVTRVAVITGAAAGLGRSCASRLAADGLRLLLVDTDAVGVAALADELTTGGAEVATCLADIRTQLACQSAVDLAVQHFGGVDVLVNAAGVYPRKPVLEISAEDWQFVFNVLGTYFMMTAAIADMRTRGRGHIVNISSIDGFKAHPANAHYAATKAAVISLTRSIALEVAPLGILVNSVAPGPMATASAKLTDWYEPMVASLPTRQPIEPDEIARLVAYLSHTDNISIAGENIVVSGAAVIV
jgi:NAD(P)-dependent dehydrogenase (short-subunit alcohol dehydrogenase family)